MPIFKKRNKITYQRAYISHGQARNTFFNTTVKIEYMGGVFFCVQDSRIIHNYQV